MAFGAAGHGTGSSTPWSVGVRAGFMLQGGSGAYRRNPPKLFGMMVGYAHTARPTLRIQARAHSVHAERLQFVAPGIRDRRLAAVGKHDRRAVGRVQGVKQRAGRELGRLREMLLHVLGADRPDIGKLASAKTLQPLWRDGMDVERVTRIHGPRLLSVDASLPSLVVPD